MALTDKHGGGSIMVWVSPASKANNRLNFRPGLKKRVFFNYIEIDKTNGWINPVFPNPGPRCTLPWMF